MLIGFHAYKQGGKDTAYQRLVELYGPHMYQVKRVSFADLLYRSAAAALGVTVEELYRWKVEPNVKVAIIRRGVIDRDGQEGPPVVLREITVREYLQFYGTEAHRDIFGSDFWVEAVNLYHDPRHARTTAEKPRIVVVTDCRFQNEAEAIRKYGGVIVNLIGPPEVEHAGDGHESEKPLPPELIDFVIDNSVRDDGFQSLDHQLRSLVAELRRGEP
jgi:hypothetical protein